MKKILPIMLIAVVAVTGLTNCKKRTPGGGGSTKADIVLTVPYTKAKVLPAIDSPFNMFSIPLDVTDTFATKVDEYLATYAGGLSKTKIKSLKPTSMNVLVDNTTAQTFNFIDDSVKIYVDKYGGTNPVLVAYKKGIPANSKQIVFDIVDTDIKDLFNDPYMQVTLKCNTKIGEKIIANTNFVSNFSFTIIADPN